MGHTTAAVSPMHDPLPPEPGEEAPSLALDALRQREAEQRSHAQAATFRGRGTGLDTVSLADLMAEPDTEPPWAVDGIVPQVGVTVLAGPPKVGKTLLVQSMALAAADRARPHEVLGRDVRRGPVLYVLEEGSRAGLRYRVHRQASALGITDAAVAFAYRQHVRLDDRNSLARLRGEVQALRPVLVVVDPLNRVHSRNEDKATEMTPVMDALAGVAYDFRTAVVAIHHVGKPSESRTGQDRLRGSGAIRSGTDANLILDGSGILRLEGEYRDAERLSMSLRLDPDTLLLEQSDAPERGGKIAPADLLAFITERGQVNARAVMEQWTVTRNTAKAALDGLDRAAIDSAEDARLGRIWFPRQLPLSTCQPGVSHVN